MSVATIATQLYQLGKLSFQLKHYHIDWFLPIKLKI